MKKRKLILSMFAVIGLVTISWTMVHLGCMGCGRRASQNFLRS